jgi:DNA-3-methyladenine glycosylase I
VFCQLVTEHGSFARYLDSLGGDTFRIRDDLRRRFRYLGPRTVLHFMMNLWFPVLKPDLAVCRILTRLGFIESPRNEEDQIDQALRAGMRIAHAVGKPIRYVDAILVMYGQVSYKKMGIEKGVCLLKPRCEACGVKVSCLFPAGLAR